MSDYKNPLSEMEIALILQTMRCKYQPSQEFFNRLIDLVSLLSGFTAPGPFGSRHYFDKYFDQLAPAPDVETIHYCRLCYCYVTASDTERKCTDSSCANFETTLKVDDFFLWTSLKTLVTYTLENPEVEKDILDYRNTPKSTTLLKDVRDSLRYEELVMYHYKQHSVTSGIIPWVSISLNLDGVQIAKSSSKSLYPLIFSVNEISPPLRRKFLGVPMLWMKTKEKKFNDMILSKAIGELNEASEAGVYWKDSRGILQNTKVYLYCTCVDAPVKHQSILGITSHSGYSSCPICLMKGEYAKKGKGGAVVFPGSGSAELRDAKRLKVGQEGQQRVPEMLKILSIEERIFETCAIDSLHGVYLGGVRYLLRVDFIDVKPKSMKDRRLAVVNKVLASINPPTFIERGPRTFEEFSFFKGHELANFLDYYCPPVIEACVAEGLMEPIKLEHWWMLSRGISLLNSIAISKDDITNAEYLLERFVDMIPAVYGVPASTYNLHVLCHLPRKVEYLGPLWSTAMFMFEGFNPTIINGYSGTRCPMIQIGRTLSLRFAVVLLHTKVKLKYPDSISLDHGLFIGGKPSKTMIMGIEQDHGSRQIAMKTLIDRFASISICDFNVVDMIMFNNTRFTSMAYHLRKTGKYCNSYVYNARLGMYGLVKHIIVRNRSAEIYIVFQPARVIDCGSQFEIVDEQDLLKCDFIEYFGLAIRVDYLNSNGACFLSKRTNRVAGR